MYKQFFDYIDEIVDPNMVGHSFSRLYYDFFEELKEVRCTSANFTGFSELLVFRLVVKIMGAGFKPVNLSNDVKHLVRDNISIRQGASIKFTTALNKQERIQPDLSIHIDDKVKSLISIKTYLVTSSIIDDELQKIEHLRKDFPELKCLFLLFSWFKSEERRELEKYAKKNSWFKYQSLHDEYQKTMGEIIQFILPN